MTDTVIVVVDPETVNVTVDSTPDIVSVELGPISGPPGPPGGGGGTVDSVARGLITAHSELTTTAHGGIVAGDDPRLTDARTPTAHTHPWSQITDKPSFGSAATADVGDFATAAQGTKADNAVPTTRTVAGKALSSNITLAAFDVGADPTGTAADAVAALREIAAGIGTQPNTSVTGFLGVDAVTRRRAGLEVGNTAADTTMLPSTISYAANHFTLSRVLQLDFGGLYTNNSAANRDVTVRVKLQGKTVFAFAATAIPANATSRSWRASCRIQFGDFIGTRAFGFGSLSMSAAGAGFDLGQVTAAADLAQTFDLAASMALDVTVQHSTNNANLKMSVANFYATELLAVT